MDNTDLTRPIVGIENRTAQEVFDIMSDRIKHSASRSHPAPTEPSREGWAKPDYWAVWSTTGMHIGTWADEALALAALEEHESNLGGVHYGTIKALYATSSKPVTVTDEMVDALLRDWYGETYNPGALGPEVREYHRQKAYSALTAALSGGGDE